MNARQQTIALVWQIAQPLIEAQAMELVDVELSGGRSGPLVRVYIDRAGGVNVDDCATISRLLSAALDVENPIAGRYTLEVSSPGLDRPLKTPTDFCRRIGEQIKVMTLEPLEGERIHTGRLDQVTETAIALLVGEKTRWIGFDQITKAKVEVLF